MNDLQMQAPQGNFEIHPAGPCMAVCRDIWSEEIDNPKAGQVNQWGKVEKPKVRYIHFEFLTDEPIEINGQMLPRFVKRRLNHGWGEKSACRAFVSAWNPALGKDDNANLSSLVGAGAYLNIIHETKGDKTYANIATIVPPPKGATIPLIPKDFVRHAVREQQQPAQGGPLTSGLGKPGDVEDIDF